MSLAERKAAVKLPLMDSLRLERRDFLAHLLAIPFSAKKQACGPEGRALRGKSIGGKRIPSGDQPVLP
jgi:hypothetical protein